MIQTERLAKIKAGLEALLVLANEPDYLWQDDIQNGEYPWGFDQIRTAYNKIDIPPSDEGGANISRIANPYGEGFVLRLYGDLSKPGSGCRAQGGITGLKHKAFNDAARKGIYIEQECYLPRALSANSDAYSWLSFQDIHVTDAPKVPAVDRLRSYLGLKVVQDGSMRARLDWGGYLYKVNLERMSFPPVSAIPLPVGRWFKIKTHFILSSSPTTVRVWFDDELALQWDNVINALPSNTIVEYYTKLYGGVQIDPNGNSSPWGGVERFTRNVRIYQ